MRLCQKCNLVKLDFQFHKEWYGAAGYGYYETTWVCKKCARNIEEEALYNEVHKEI